MSRARIGLGRLGEALAREALITQGYVIRGSNVRSRYGEIDLVAEQAGTWAFVEVRARRGPAFGLPEDSLTPRKRRHMIAAAQAYLRDHELSDVPWRIDFVAVELTSDGRLMRVEVIQNAVEG